MTDERRAIFIVYERRGESVKFLGYTDESETAMNYAEDVAEAGRDATMVPVWPLEEKS